MYKNTHPFVYWMLLVCCFVELRSQVCLPPCTRPMHILFNIVGNKRNKSVMGVGVFQHVCT